MAIRPMNDSTMSLTDGRALAFAEWGDPQGRPVLYCHGGGQGRLFCPDRYNVQPSTADCRVRLITVDRPGFGSSDNDPARTLTSWANDIRQLTDELKINRFAVVGYSAGGPFALACAFRLPDRVTSLGLVAATGPSHEVPGEWDELPPELRVLLTEAERDPLAVRDRLRQRYTWFAGDLDAFLNPAEFPQAETWWLTDPQTRSTVLEELEDARRPGVDGIVWDTLCTDSAWPFSPRDLSLPTFVWQGTEDTLQPRRHYDYFLSAIPDARAKLWDGEGHAAILHGSYWGEVLSALTGDTPSRPVYAETGVN
jgi:pimeloyl-ACP methyl ester carboxylesterase